MKEGAGSGQTVVSEGVPRTNKQPSLLFYSIGLIYIGSFEMVSRTTTAPDPASS